jgi:hypothetical protein
MLCPRCRFHVPPSARSRPQSSGRQSSGSPSCRLVVLSVAGGSVTRIEQHDQIYRLERQGAELVSEATGNRLDFTNERDDLMPRLASLLREWNVLLVGEEGVGRRGLVRALAYRILWMQGDQRKGEAPDERLFPYRRIYATDPTYRSRSRPTTPTSSRRSCGASVNRPSRRKRSSSSRTPTSRPGPGPIPTGRSRTSRASWPA